MKKKINLSQIRVGVYRIEFSEHECLENQQPERCSIKCISLPVLVTFYQQVSFSLTWLILRHWLFLWTSWIFVFASSL